MKIQKIGVFDILPQAPIYTSSNIAKDKGTFNHSLINHNDHQSISL